MDTEEDEMDSRQLVCACLHYRGVAQVSNEVDVEARYLADGFGPGQIPNSDCFWDWSHVRDSSEEAIEDIADYLREVVDESEIAAAVEANGGQALKPWRA